MNETVRCPWPGWVVGERLGSGGFGVVYEITRTGPNGTVEKNAMKVVTVPQKNEQIKQMRDNGYSDAGIEKTLEQQSNAILEEYYKMKDLGSNIVLCYDREMIKHNDGLGWDIFIRMEKLTCLTAVVQDVVKKENLSEEVIKIGKDLCCALIACHEQNIIHRDIKPANIYRSDNNIYKLGDFGVSRILDHTMYATRTGTELYMAPEVAKREQYNNSADIYSLGLVLYWLLNNCRLPFEIPQLDGEAQRKALSQRLKGDKIPRPLRGSETLKNVVLKALSYDSNDRYTSQEMYNALNEISANRDEPPNPDVEHPEAPGKGNSWPESPPTTGDDEPANSGDGVTGGTTEDSQDNSNTGQNSGENKVNNHHNKNENLTAKWWIFTIVAFLTVIIVLLVWKPWDDNTIIAETPTPEPSPKETSPRPIKQMGPFSSGRLYFVNGGSIDVPEGFEDGNNTRDYQTGLDVDGYWYYFYNSEYNMEIYLSEAELDSYIIVGKFGTTGSEVLKAKYDEFLLEKSDPVWKELDARCYHITGYSGDSIYYYYGVWSGDTIYTINFQYPKINKATCDHIVAAVEASFSN